MSKDNEREARVKQEEHLKSISLHDLLEEIGKNPSPRGIEPKLLIKGNSNNALLAFVKIAEVADDETVKEINEHYRKQGFEVFRLNDEAEVKND